MKILTYKFDTDITDSLEAHILDIEKELGVHLMKHSVDDTAPIHGHVNASSDGKIEVCLYEESDIKVLDQTEAHLKSHDNYSCAGTDYSLAQKNLESVCASKQSELSTN